MDQAENSVVRTKLANQRTYLAYMRTGFAIAALAGSFQKKWIGLVGLIMILGSVAQYYHVNDHITKKTKLSNKYDLLPLLFTCTSLAAFYLEFIK